MRHSSRRLAPSWGLLCSQISVEPYIPKGPANVKITTLYRLGQPHGHNDSCFLCYFYIMLFFFFFFFFLVCQVRTCTFYMCLVTQKCFSGMVDLVCFKPAWSAAKADEQSDLHLWCSHMSYDTFSHDLAYTEIGIPTNFPHFLPN